MRKQPSQKFVFGLTAQTRMHGLEIGAIEGTAGLPGGAAYGIACRSCAREAGRRPGEGTLRKPGSVRGLEDLGRVRLSAHFFMREFLYSEVANFHALPNVPDDPDLAVAMGRRLCTELLEPLRATFGAVSVRSGYRSPTVNAFCNARGYSCARNLATAANHIWDMRDAKGRAGAMATVVVPWLVDQGRHWTAMAWWIHDHLPYSRLQIFPKLLAFNIGWREEPERVIHSFVAPRGNLTHPGMPGHESDHSAHYPGFPALRGAP